MNDVWAQKKGRLYQIYVNAHSSVWVFQKKYSWWPFYPMHDNDILDAIIVSFYWRSNLLVIIIICPQILWCTIMNYYENLQRFLFEIFFQHTYLRYTIKTPWLWNVLFQCLSTDLVSKHLRRNFKNFFNRYIRIYLQIKASDWWKWPIIPDLT